MSPLDVSFAGPYNALDFGGLAVGFGLAWWEGRRRGWPLLPWLALLAAWVAERSLDLAALRTRQCGAARERAPPGSLPAA